jgi:hypothetical protein
MGLGGGGVFVGMDDQLRMIFICCQPAEPREAPTLKTVGGSVPEIARAYLAKEATIAQRPVPGRLTYLIVAAFRDATWKPGAPCCCAGIRC